MLKFINVQPQMHTVVDILDLQMIRENLDSNRIHNSDFNHNKLHLPTKFLSIYFNGIRSKCTENQATAAKSVAIENRRVIKKAICLLFAQ